MKVLGHRFCVVAPSNEAFGFSVLLRSLGLSPKEIFTSGKQPDDADFTAADFGGASFETGNEHSWVEIWSEVEGTPKGIMLQLVVDDADAFAETARENGLEPHGPVDAHGERIYFVTAPTGMAVSFQSKL